VRGAAVIDDARAWPRHSEVPHLQGAHGRLAPGTRCGGVGVGVHDPVEADGGEEHPEGQPALPFVVQTLAAVASDERVAGQVSPWSWFDRERG
jgi:hypothetical protein